MEPERKSNGALIGSIIVIVILIIGGIYIWQSKVKDTLMNEEAGTIELNSELELLEEDLNTVDLNLEIDLENLE